MQHILLMLLDGMVISILSNLILRISSQLRVGFISHRQYTRPSEGHNFVVCSFVARMYDYHPLSIPAPYNHSNIDSDEVLFYAEGDFMSRNHIDLCDFTLHPGGIAHGPHPGAMERSIGQKETHEYAVMVDPFRPLKLTEEAESRRSYL